jgi:membrane protein
MADLSTYWNKFTTYVTHDLWRLKAGETQLLPEFLENMIRICVLAFRHFIKVDLQLRASALTYYSILSIVPIVAVVFGIAKGFGVQEEFLSEVTNAFPAQQDIMLQVVVFARNLLDTTSGGLIAGLGLVFLFWSVLSVMMNIETTLNDIWEVQTPRTWVRRFTDYFSILLLAPFGIILVSTINVFIQTQLQNFIYWVGLSGFLASMTDFAIGLIPVLLLSLLFSIFYMVMPNARVSFKSAFYAGLIAGIAFQVVQSVYIGFQIGVSRANAIYGSFAALPLFLIWMHISWNVVVTGGIIAFVHQNFDRKKDMFAGRKLSHREWLSYQLWQLFLIAERFKSHQQPLTSLELSEKVGLPSTIVQKMLKDLTTTGYVTIQQSDQEVDPKRYVPAFDIHDMQLREILSTLEKKEEKTESSKAFPALEKATPFDHIYQQIDSYFDEDDVYNIRGKDILNLLEESKK